MTRVWSVMAALLAGSVSAQRLNPNVPFTTPPAQAAPRTSSATPQQIKDAQTYYAPPRVVSTSMIYAVNLIINERRSVTGLIGPLDRQLATALERAGQVVPVQLAVGGGKRLNLKYARQYVGQAALGYTIIATAHNTIVWQGGQLKIWDSPFQADQVRDSLKPYFNAPATR